MRGMILALMMVLAGCAMDDSVDAPMPVARQQTAGHFDVAVSAVLPVARQWCARRAVQNCDFAIVVDDRPGRAPNATQSIGPGGRPVLTFTTALIAKARNSDEIALIVAHEAAHHIDGHLAQLNQSVTALLAQDHVADAGWSHVHAEKRRFELAADTLGAQIMAAAGFDPQRAAQIFLRLPDPAQHAFGSYPANADRFLAVRDAPL